MPPPRHEPGRDDRPSDDVIGPDLRAGREERALGDFTMSWRAIRLIPIAAVIGVLAAFVALLLLDLIALITNLAYYHRLSITPVSPALNTLGTLAVLVPMVGGLIVGLMARFGSERIRGHGIPEAMEAILVGGSKVQPRVTILKPLSSAISIGTGGPFGAEGPIILTGGALGSVIAQFFHLSSIERRTLLVAGAAAGMSAIFGTPVAAVVLGIELLLFEWKPRSLTVVATASVTAASVRAVLAQHTWLPQTPLFPLPDAALHGAAALIGALALGVVCGGVAWVVTKAVYGAEDAFARLPIHWSWWPVLGGLVIGVGGLIQPRALGVGYETIGATLAGNLAVATLVSLLVVKLVIWSVGLGSGTSGGVLAPILMMGAAVGGILAPVLPGGTPSTWALLGMAAVMAGVMRSPLTAVIFAVELTHDVNLLLPLLLVAVAAYLVSVLTLRRSILTEKVARRGFHVVCEYGVEPLEALLVRDVMATEVVGVSSGRPIGAAYEELASEVGDDPDRLLPIVSSSGSLLGSIRWEELATAAATGDGGRGVGELVRRDTIVVHPDETLRTAADRMVVHKVRTLPVVDRSGSAHLVGLVGEPDLLRAREHRLVEERHRERVLRLRR